MEHRLAKTDMKVIKKVYGDLKQAGFNTDRWDIKEIPVEDEVYIFQNYDDTLEFTVVVDEDEGISYEYTILDDNSLIVYVYTYKLQEALENRESGRTPSHRGHGNKLTVFQEFYPF